MTNDNYTVYILQCSDKSYYTGITNDLDRRLWEHEEGINPKSYTYNRRPLELVFTEHFPDPNQAIAFEKQIKGWNRKKKAALIQGNWEEIVRLSNLKKQTKSHPSTSSGCRQAQDDHNRPADINNAKRKFSP